MIPLTGGREAATLSELLFEPPSWVPAFLFEGRTNGIALLLIAFLVLLRSGVGGALLALYPFFFALAFVHVWAENWLIAALLIVLGSMAVNVGGALMGYQRLRRQTLGALHEDVLQGWFGFMRRSASRYAAFSWTAFFYLVGMAGLAALGLGILFGDNTSSLVRQGGGRIFLPLALAFLDLARERSLISLGTGRLRDNAFLFLRSFADDDVHIDSPIARVFGRKSRFELYLERLLRRYGTLVAIAQPDREHPLGAIRTDVGDDDWRARVRSLIAEAQKIFLVVGRTPNLRWELEAVAELGAIHKLVLIFPPRQEDPAKTDDDPTAALDRFVRAEELRFEQSSERWQTLMDIDREPFRSLKDLDIREALVVCLPSDRRAFVVKSAGTSIRDYEMTMKLVVAIPPLSYQDAEP